MMRRRKELATRDPEAGRRLARNVLDGVTLPEGARVSVFWAMASEIDTRPLLEALNAAGYETALPVVIAKDTPLVFRRWRPGDVLVPAGFGTEVPAPDKPEVVPDVVCVPLLAFDRNGYRLGYGGGFYDRTLAQLDRIARPQTVGLAYAGQEVDEVPHDERDWPLDWIVTEAEIIAADHDRAKGGPAGRGETGPAGGARKER